MAEPSARVAGLSAVKLALLARQMRSQVEDVLRAEPIAVIGMGCRVPGAQSPESFWTLLMNGVDAVREVPEDRWNADALYDPDFNAPGKVSSRWGGFLDQIDGFDPTFFGITPREAQRMDPQQRLFLEVAYEALEDAGVTDTHLNGSQAGVFVASYHNDYTHMQYSYPDLIDGRTLTGALQSIVSNRLSFLLNAHGPSLTLDTACSSSLVAVHLACQSLRSRECDLAAAGGVNVMTDAALNIAMSRVGFLSPTGRCRTFDAGADGFVRGEGCGVVILKRLADAIADGDSIRAVIRGSAVNQDGRSNVLTAPNGMAHRQLVRAALHNAGLSAQQITYVEAHGTGTALGDPIEVEALAEVLGQGDQPCVLGSAKTNIGHLEAAAGVVGLIKSVLSLEHECIPGNVHFTALNPHISLEGTRLVISNAAQPWARGSLPRFVGVSSFGVGGTNAHVILEEAPLLPAPQAVESPAYFLPLSAHTAQALRARAADLRDWLISDTAASLSDVCFTASARRSHHDYRLGVVGAARADVAEQLDSFARGEARPGVFAGYTPDAGGKLAFVFSGQGPQWWAMGRELLDSEPVFRQAIEQIDGLLRPYTGWSLVDELRADESASRLDQTEVAQPAIFALQVALTALWRAWGVAPDAVVGHSVGEIAAAHAAGVLSFEDAVRVVYHRSRLMQRATGHGRMAAVELPAAEAERAIAGYADRVSVAAVNSPTSVTLSGEPAALDAVLDTLGARGVAAKMMRVSYAFHSPQMDPFQAELAVALAGLKPNKAAAAIWSTVTGQEAADDDFGAEYWARNIRQPVRFADAIGAMTARGCTTFVEISPHPALAPSLEQCLEGSGVVLPSLRRGRPERATMLAALAGLYTRGCLPDWKGVYPFQGGLARLPNYPWQRERYWLDVPKHRPNSTGAAGGNPLLGRRLQSPSLADIVYEAELSAEWPPFASDHCIYDAPVLPATAYVEMALAALGEAAGWSYTLDDLLIQEALILREGTRVQTILRADGDQFSFEVVSQNSSGDWTRHASGRAAALERLPDTDTLAAARSRCPETIAVSDHYWQMETQGLAFGARFRGLTSLRRGSGEVVARVELPGDYRDEARAYGVYPPLLDACLQALSAAFNLEAGESDLYLPLNIGQIQMDVPLSETLWSHARISERPSPQKAIFTGDVTLYDDGGNRVGVVRGFQFIRADRGSLERAVGQPLTPSDWLYETRWQAAPMTAQPAPDAAVNWLVVGSAGGIGAEVAARLRALGYANVTESVVDGSIRAADAYTAVVNSADADSAWRIVYLPAADRPFTGDPQADQPLIVGELLPLLRVFRQPPRLYLVTRGAQPAAGTAVTAPSQATLWGVASTVALEFPAWHCARIDLDPNDLDLSPLLNELVSESLEDRIAFRGGRRYAARLAPLAIAPDESADERPQRLEIPASHLIEDLVFRPASRRRPGPGEVEIRVAAAGLNFRDVLKTLGMYPGPAGPLGDECAGEIVAVGAGVQRFVVGDRVVGIASSAFDTYVTARADLLAALPASLSFEDGAGLPIAFLTAYYALHHLAQLQPGQRVLIHAAAGGVGLAAVQLALLAGAEVIGTAGSPEKRSFLQSLGVHHVFHSRTLDFADEILALTHGDGVDVVLNSLAGEFIPKSLSLVRANGCFLEIGKSGIWDNEQVAALKPDIAYHVIFLGDQFKSEPALIRTMLEDVVAAAAAGRLQVLPKQVFTASDIPGAFRYMAQARHIGKIIITREAGRSIRPDGAYLITGGLGGIGLELARWLAAQGARHLILMGRREPTEYGRTIVEDLQRGGVRVVVMHGDVARRDDLQRVLDEAELTLPPLRGLFHTAGINADGVLLGLDWPRFESVMSAKVGGTLNLHALTQHLPLDHFVLFSSIAATLGSEGQGNYAAANAFLDAFAAWRHAQGLPALSINWGPWERLGMTAVLSAADVQRVRRRGIESFMPEQAMYALGHLLSHDTQQATVLNMNWRAFAKAFDGQPVSPFFADVVKPVPASAKPPADTRSAALAGELRQAAANQRRRLLLTHVREQAGLVMGLPASALSDPRQPLNAIGLDSLMAVELRNALGQSTGEALPATLVFDYPTLDALTDYLLNVVLKLGESEPAQPEAVEAARPDAAGEVAALSDDEAEALLLEELMKPRKKG